MKEGIIISDFQEYLKTMNRSEKTIKTYTYSIIDFFKFLCDQKKVKEISNIILFNISKEDVYLYIYYISLEKKNKTSIKCTKVIALRQFYKWLLKNNPEIENPLEGVTITIRGFRLPKVLTLKQAVELQEVYKDDRNSLIIQIFLQTGLRINELSNLRVKKIDLENKQMKVWGKGNKERTVYLTSKLAYFIRRYIENHHCSKFLFEGRSNGHISNSNIRNIVYEAYCRIGIGDKGYTVHTLRHTFASIIYQTTKDALVVKEALGHQDLISTQKYIHINSNSTKSAVDRNPLNNLRR